jgi:uncharacterized protein
VHLAEAAAILAAGVAAGGVNAIVGSGSLITFPTLLAFGFPPIVANVSNNIGQVPGNASGAVGYRPELSGQRGRLVRLGLAALAGSVAGAALLLSLPSHAFRLIVAVLIVIACVLVLTAPRVNAWLAARAADRPSHGGPVLVSGIFLASVYGGYFGAAQGVLIIGLLGSFLDEPVQRVNGAKNVLVVIVNGAAAVVFIVFARIAWAAVLLIAAGSAVGGVIGARYGRRLRPGALRVFVVVIGLISAVKLIFF